MISERVRSVMTKDKKIGHLKLRMSDTPQKFRNHYDSYKASQLLLTELARLVHGQI